MPVSEKTDEEKKEFSKFNALLLELNREDEALKACHSLIFKSNKGDFTVVEESYHALKHAYVILKWAYHKDDRMRIDKRIKNIKEAIQKAKETRKFDTEIYEDLYDVLDLIYEAKQKINLGVPMQVYKGDEARLKEAMQA